MSEVADDKFVKKTLDILADDGIPANIIKEMREILKKEKFSKKCVFKLTGYIKRLKI